MHILCLDGNDVISFAELQAAMQRPAWSDDAQDVTAAELQRIMQSADFNGIHKTNLIPSHFHVYDMYACDISSWHMPRGHFDHPHNCHVWIMYR